MLLATQSTNLEFQREVKAPHRDLLEVEAVGRVEITQADTPA